MQDNPDSTDQPGQAPQVQDHRCPLFPLGTLLATPAALEHLEKHGVSVQALLERHVHGDWGDDISVHDARENEFSAERFLRVISAYRIGDEKVWIITEADRSGTTAILAREY